MAHGDGMSRGLGNRHIRIINNRVIASRRPQTVRHDIRQFLPRKPTNDARLCAGAGVATVGIRC